MFTNILQHVNGGSVEEIEAKLSELVKAVKLTGKGGSIRITLTVKPAMRGDADTVSVEDEITVKLPSLNRRSALFYTTEDNQLSRTNPNQPELKLQIVKSEEAQPLKKAS